MSLYAELPVTVPEPIVNAHERELASFSAPGCWLSGEERWAVVRYARQCREEAGLQPLVADAAAPDPGELLPAAMLALVKLIALEPKELSSDDYTGALANGLSDGEYVEVVGLVARSVNLDIFARGLGASPTALKAVEDGEPVYESPVSAVREGGWVPTVPFGPEGGEAAIELYGKGMMPFIYRALSLVPSEASLVLANGNVQYLGMGDFGDYSYSPFPPLSRAQVELLAGRVSAFNECFY